MDQKTQREIYSLEFWIGKEIHALIPMLNPDSHVWITIRNVEAAGIWIECERLTIGYLPGKSGRGELDDVGKVVAFVPFSQIVYIGTLDYRGQPVQRARVLRFGGKGVSTPAFSDKSTQDNPQQKENELGGN